MKSKEHAEEKQKILYFLTIKEGLATPLVGKLPHCKLVIMVHFHRMPPYLYS